MEQHCSGALPGTLLTQREQIDFIVDFWNALRIDDDPGSTTWEVLEDLERQVTECLDGVLPDIDSAWGLTAQAMLLMTGQLRL
jgi:hypothetical protein